MSERREGFEEWAVKRGISTIMHNERYWQHDTHVAWQAWKAACPDGWQCVPKETTLGMLNEGHRKMFGYEAGPTSEVWQAMLAAAPKPGDV